MKKLFIVANWKSHKTLAKATAWLETLSGHTEELDALEDKTIIVCPSFPQLAYMQSRSEKSVFPLSLGAQNISPFGEGNYTGEVTAQQLHEYASYVIIGHSERRQNFFETDDILKEKVLRAQEVGLKVIFCVQGKDTFIPQDVDIVAYEPVEAIGTGNPDNPKNVEEVAAFLRREKKIETVIYGGSVTGKNVKEFTELPSIAGVLVGSASLDAEEFFAIISHA